MDLISAMSSAGSIDLSNDIEQTLRGLLFNVLVEAENIEEKMLRESNEV